MSVQDVYDLLENTDLENTTNRAKKQYTVLTTLIEQLKGLVKNHGGDNHEQITAPNGKILNELAKDMMAFQDIMDKLSNDQAYLGRLVLAEHQGKPAILQFFEVCTFTANLLQTLKKTKDKLGQHLWTSIMFAQNGTTAFETILARGTGVMKKFVQRGLFDRPDGLLLLIKQFENTYSEGKNKADNRSKITGYLTLHA